ncbi:winged helix DNA-binding domain-containing protein [Agromyces albus]|uniref:winged helix DNA-binding domain-containing protein n=1 Tax=Agromyces albus TaxID=205332 RepID=UPI0013E977AE|nr:winged helix DNA-binding domain-containing protein [Agromyces albus]
MDLARLRQLRLHVQGVREPVAASAPEVVERFVAVQSQEFVPAQWGLAARVRSEHRPDAASVAASIDRGEILRTHVLRPTWHFVSPADARWLLELSADRVHRLNATYYRRVGLEGEAAARGLDVVARALEGGHRTRAQLTAALDEAGSPMAGLAFGYLLMLAELERVAISGANVGKQRTYAAFDERVPASAPKPRDEALAELAERFIGSRGPANERDFAAWSGFTLGDARQAFADAADRSDGRITTVDVDGAAQWLDTSTVPDAAAAASATDSDTDRVDLLQAYDEYIMGYAAPRAYLQSPERPAPVGAEFPLHALMIGGVMCGRWAPVVNAKHAVVRIVPWRTFSPAEERSLAASVAELERFLGLPVTVDRNS